MDYLPILERTLSQTCEVICSIEGRTREEIFKSTEEYIALNSASWRTVDPKIDYKNSICRMAYIYMNVAIHANLVEKALSSSIDCRQLIHSKIRNREEIQVCAIGGGPGSELLGLVSFIESINTRNKSVFIDFLLVDAVKEWDETWHALKAGVDQQMKKEYGNDRNKWVANISRSFLPLDATSINDFENFRTRFSGVDLFICSYFVSEVKSSPEGFSKVIEFLADKASEESIFLFIDRDEKSVRETVQKIVANISTLEIKEIQKSRGRLIINLSDLGDWYINIEPLPRQKWLSFFAVVTKVGTKSIHPLDIAE